MPKEEEEREEIFLKPGEKPKEMGGEVIVRELNIAKVLGIIGAIAIVSFTAIAFTVLWPGGGPPITLGSAGQYFWDFGDGNTAIGFNPMHVYQEAGTYTVKVKFGDSIQTYDISVDAGERFIPQIVEKSGSLACIPASGACPSCS